MSAQFPRDTHVPGVLFDELVIDSFAGGGGASLGIEWGIGRAVNVAINHDPEAVAMHKANHPLTDHYCQDVWAAEPVKVTGGKPVGLAWFSPDCTYHSKARGSKPIRPKNAKRRDLAWVIIKWAKAVRPRVIMLENVEEFRDWGPLVDGRPCKVRKGKTFRAWKSQLQNAGYEVQDRILRACDYGSPTIRKRLFVIARCDGAPIVWPEVTHAANGVRENGRAGSRRRSGRRGNQLSERYETGARGDGASEHHQARPGTARPLAPFRTAADCIDWSLACPSIFLTREEATAYYEATGDRIVRPLKPKTMERIRNGLKRYVIEAAKLFIVRCNHGGDHFRGQPVDKPFCTATANRDAHGLVVPYTVGAGGSGYAGKPKSMGEPLGTVMVNDRRSLVAAFLAKHYTGVVGHEIDKPAGTITTLDHHSVVSAFMSAAQHGGSNRDAAAPMRTVTASTKDQNCVVSAFIAQQNGEAPHQDMRGQAVDRPLSTIACSNRHKVVAASMTKLRGTARDGQSLDQPAPTITAGGTHEAVVAASLSHNYTSNTNGGGHTPDDPLKTIVAGANHASLVYSFLQSYYGEGSGKTGRDVAAPLPTVTTKDRTGIVTVNVNGEPHVITDIGMRMLTPRELYRCQGFPDSYIIDPIVNGKRLTKSAQVRMCGNSVCPQVAAALVRANLVEVRQPKQQEVA